MKKLITMILIFTSLSSFAKMEALIGNAWVEVQDCYINQNVNPDGSPIVTIITFDHPNDTTNNAATKCRETISSPTGNGHLQHNDRLVPKHQFDKKDVKSTRGTSKRTSRRQ